MADFPEVKECIEGIQSSLQCSICLELFRKPVVTKCGHKFCEGCITQCFKRKASVPCPSCAEPVTKRSLKQGERLQTLTTAVRELVRVYEEDSRDAFTVPSGPSRSKPVETRAPVATKPEKVTSERVAMASLENTDTDVIDVSDAVSESKKLTRRLKATKTRSKRSKECFVGNDDTSVFSAERSASDIAEGSVGKKEPAPDIFAEEDLCPTTREKRNGKVTRLKVQNWLSRWLPPVPGTEDDWSPANDDSQSSDHTVLLESDTDVEAMMDISSSQNATIAPDSSRSLSLSSGTSPNQRRFFKFRDQKSELTRVNVISPTSKSDDPYAFPTSATKPRPKRPTRKSKPSVKTNSPSTTVVTAAGSFQAALPFTSVKRNIVELNENWKLVADQGVDSTSVDTDCKDERKSTESIDCFCTDSVDISKAKGARTYANNRRYRLRSRRTRQVNYVDDEDEHDPDFRLPALLGERSDCSTLVEEPIAKKRKGDDSVELPIAGKIRDELEGVEAFQLDVMTASQDFRETNEKREQISSRAKKEVKKILERDAMATSAGSSIVSQEEPSAGTSSAGDVTEYVRNDGGMNWDESDPIEDQDSDSGTEELILEIHVKDPDHPSQPSETVKRIYLSPAPAEALESPQRFRPKTGERNEPIEVQSQYPEVLEPVSLQFADSEMPDSPRKVENVTESREEAIRKRNSQSDVAISPKPVLIGSEGPVRSPIGNDSKKKIRANTLTDKRRNSPIIMSNLERIRQEGKRSETEENGKETVISGNFDRENALLKCRESDSSGDELPDLSSQLRTNPSFKNNVVDDVERVDDVIICKVPSDDAGEDGGGDDATDVSADVTESISLSVSQVRFEKPMNGALGTSESPSTISSIYAPCEPLNSEHNFSMQSPSGKQCVSKSTSSSKTKTNTCSDYSKLSSETQATNLTMFSEVPTTQMQENLQKELQDLSRLIREKEAQLLQLKTQGDSTLAPDSDSESDLFASQDATVYGRVEEAGVEPRRSPVFSPMASPAPPTPPSVQKSNHSGCDSIIAPTPRKSPRSLAAELARTFSSIKAAGEADDDETEFHLAERPAQKRDWKRIRTGSDSDSDSEMVVPNSFEDATPKRRGSLDIFITKKRLLEEASTTLADLDENDEPIEESSSSLLMKTPTNRSFRKNQRSSKGSELVKGLTKHDLLDRESGSAGLLGGPMVARGGLPVIPSLSRTRCIDLSVSTTSHKRRKLNEANRAPSSEDLLSDSCDFMAAMRSPSPEPLPTQTTVVPDSGANTVPEDVTGSAVLQNSSSDKDLNAGQSSTKDSEMEVVEATVKVTPASAVATPTPIPVIALAMPTPIPAITMPTPIPAITTPTPIPAIMAPTPFTALATPTPIPTVSARTPFTALATPRVLLQSPLSVSANLAMMSPYQGELLRAQREQHRGLVVSGLDSQSREFVSAFTKKFDFRFSQNFGDETSHVVLQTAGERELVCDRTLKYFLGIAGRCWVLSKQWLIDSIEQDFLEPEDSYEIKGDTVNGEEHFGPWRARNARAQLLADFTICCHGDFSNLSRGEMVRLIEMCGGRAVIDEESFADPGPRKWRRLLLAEPHDDLRSSYFHALKRKYGMPVVSREWLLDSIAKYQVQKLKDYSLCTSVHDH